MAFYDEIVFIGLDSMKPTQAASRPSIVEIARHAGVSPSTVSRVFNDPECVLDTTREAVLRVCNEFGYRPNASARTLRTQRSQVLGVVLPTLENPVFSECLQGIASGTAPRGYAIMPVTTQYLVEAEENAVEDLQAFGVDGLILVVSDAASSQALQRLRHRAVPYVLVYNRHEAHPCVSVAGDAAMHDVVSGLMERGHKRISMVCGRLHASDRAQQRYAGFLEAMAHTGLAPCPLIEVPFIETAIQDIAAVLRRDDRPSALVCSNDLIAIRAMRAARQSGLRVPDDVSITGFDGVKLSEDLTPKLSTVAQPNAEMGMSAARWLIDSIAQKRLPESAASISLPYQVRWTESCSTAPFNL